MYDQEAQERFTGWGNHKLPSCNEDVMKVMSFPVCTCLTNMRRAAQKQHWP